MGRRFVPTIILALLFPLSARAQFSTVINVPPDVAPSSIGSDTQLNLFDSGSIPLSFVAGAADGSSTNVEVNIAGGTVIRRFYASGGSVVNVSGGTINDYFIARSGNITHISGGSFITGFIAHLGSVVNISGGTVSDNFRAFDGSTITVVGGEFRLNGAPLTGLDVPDSTLAFNLPDGSLLSGTLADGTPFAFTSQDDDGFADGTLTLRASSLPAITSPVITAKPSIRYTANLE